MSLTPLHTFTDTTLTSALLNAEFDNIVRYFGSIESTDTDLTVLTPFPYVVADTGTNLEDQIDAAIAAGKYLYLPPGTYTMGICTLPQGTKIYGAGADRVTIEPDSPGTSTYWIRIGYTETAKDIIIRGVTLNVTASASASIRMFDIGGGGADVQNIQLQDCIFTATASNTRTLVTISGASDHANVVCERCEFTGQVIGAALQNSADVIFDRCIFNGLVQGIVHLNTAYSDLEGSIVVRDCVYFINQSAYVSTMHDNIHTKATYVRNIFNITDGTGLTYVIVFGHNGTGVKLFQDNRAVRDEVTAANMYWISVNSDHVIILDNEAGGRAWRVPVSVAFYVHPTATVRTDEERQIYINRNYHYSYGQIWSYSTSVSTSTRPMFATGAKVADIFNNRNRGSHLAIGDVALMIGQYVTGSDVNKLVFQQFDSGTHYPTKSAKLVLSGSTAIYD